jgi:hypothetical protein
MKYFHVVMLVMIAALTVAPSAPFEEKTVPPDQVQLANVKLADAYDMGGRLLGTYSLSGRIRNHSKDVIRKIEVEVSLFDRGEKVGGTRLVLHANLLTADTMNHWTEVPSGESRDFERRLYFGAGTLVPAQSLKVVCRVIRVLTW